MNTINGKFKGDEDDMLQSDADEEDGKQKNLKDSNSKLDLDQKVMI